MIERLKVNNEPPKSIGAPLYGSLRTEYVCLDILSILCASIILDRGYGRGDVNIC